MSCARVGVNPVGLAASRPLLSDNRDRVRALVRHVNAVGDRVARKGVFITTSTFTNDAQKYVNQIEKRIVLIDGRQLIDLMIEHGVGVHVARNYDVKRLDADYFEEV